MANLIRIGRVSSIDYASGMVEVIYPDRDNAVTAKFPYLSFNGEYKMPEIGQNVLVLHLSSGTSAGIVLGPYWNQANNPPKNGAGVYFKKINKDTFLEAGNGFLKISSPDLLFFDANGSITLKEILKMKSDVEELRAKLTGG